MMTARRHAQGPRSAFLTIALGVLFVSVQSLALEPATDVYLNGTLVKVFFNDGDTFKVLSGPLANSRARTEGFNTLESYGPVHQWGTWNAKDLYALAKKATENARRGTWNCTSDNQRDIYGRILCRCDDLALDQIEKGLAHAMTATREPAPQALLEKQHLAMREHRGIWELGVPRYIVTSTHSSDEFGDNNGEAYDRLVSTFDGHSEINRHKEQYQSCENVCHGGTLEHGGDQGQETVAESCMRYVPNSRRFGPNRADCLKE